MRPIFPIENYIIYKTILYLNLTCENYRHTYKHVKINRIDFEIKLSTFCFYIHRHLHTNTNNKYN